MRGKTAQRRTSHNVEPNDRGPIGESSKPQEVTPEQTNHADSVTLAPLAELLKNLPTMKEFIEEMPDDAVSHEQNAVSIEQNAVSVEQRLWLRARYLGDMQAAQDLWNRSIRSTRWLTEAILECPDLFVKPLRRSTEVPIMMSLTPGSGHYYKKLVEHLRKRRLGADCGVAGLQIAGGMVALFESYEWELENTEQKTIF